MCQGTMCIIDQFYKFRFPMISYFLATTVLLTHSRPLWWLRSLEERITKEKLIVVRLGRKSCTPFRWPGGFHILHILTLFLTPLEKVTMSQKYFLLFSSVSYWPEPQKGFISFSVLGSSWYRTQNFRLIWLSFFVWDFILMSSNRYKFQFSIAAVLFFVDKFMSHCVEDFFCNCY